MTTTRRAATVVAALLLVAAAGFLFLSLRSDSDAPAQFGPQFAVPTTTTATAAATTVTVAEPDEPATTTSTVTATIVRHRLNQGGNRQANSALWRIATTRMRTDPATQRYVERRQAEGKKKREIIRCLKRYIARIHYDNPTAAPLIQVSLLRQTRSPSVHRSWSSSILAVAWR